MLNWDNIDSVFLDMDGTLLDLHFDDHFWQDFLPQRFAEKHSINTAQAHEVLVPKFKAQEGTLNWYCLDYWSRELDMDVPEMKKEVSHLIDIHDGVIDFLSALAPLHKRVVLVTNAHRKVVDLKMKHTQLEVHFDAIVSSHDLGLPKENPEFWTKLQGVEKYNPQRTLFIDDSLNVLRSARQAGIAHLLTISKPSSQKPAREINEFPVLKNFRQIIP